MGSDKAYDREIVERLVPAIWDEVYAYGMSDPRAPSRDMPKGHVDKKKGSSLYAHLADIRWAWPRCDLTLEERRALLLRYGFDMTQAYIGWHEGIAERSAGRRIERGIGKLTAFLNGDRYVDGYDVELEPGEFD